MNATDQARRIQAEEQFGVQLMDYAGQWVAVRGHEVFKYAATLDDLIERLEGHETEVKIFRVPEHPEAACLF